jgi:uncharacterized protein (DUF58 family)
MTIRPTPAGRWGTFVAMLAIGGLAIWSGVLNLHGGLDQAWPLFAFGIASVAFGAFSTTLFISATDSTIVSGTLLTRRLFERRNVIRIRASHSPATRLTFLVRPDGSEVLLTSAYLWGQERLGALAEYLGVPLDW